MLAAERLFLGIRLKRHRGESVQSFLLGIRKRCEKGQVPFQGMTRGQVPEALGAPRERISPGKDEITDLPGRGFDLTRFQDAGFRVHLSPPIICRNHAG